MTSELKKSAMSQVAKLQPTTNPTAVMQHFVLVAIAAHTDLYGNGVLALDPRTKPKAFMKFSPPTYDVSRHGVSAESALQLSPEQLDKMVVDNVARFEAQRRLLLTEAEAETRKLYYPYIGTLSPASIARAKTLDIDKYDQAEVEQDTVYLVQAIIASHAASEVTGMSAFEVQGILDQRVIEYHTCKKGTNSLDEYLVMTKEHIKAIKSMDENVSADGIGGYLGTKSDQVNRFLRGSGATTIINLHMNGQLPKEKIPHTLEEVCTLILNWSGTSGVEDEKKSTTSIMASQHEQTSKLVQPKMTQDERDKAFAKRRAQENSAAISRGVVVPPKAGWVSNPGAPIPALTRTKERKVQGDRPCFNCSGYHNKGTSRTGYWQCPIPWDAATIDKNNAFKATQAERTLSEAASTPPAATANIMTVVSPSSQFTQGEQAAAYAAITAMRANNAAQHSQTINATSQYPSEPVVFTPGAIDNERAYEYPYQYIGMTTTETQLDDKQPTQFLLDRKNRTVSLPAFSRLHRALSTLKVDRKGRPFAAELLSCRELASWTIDCGVVPIIEDIIKVTGGTSGALGGTLGWLTTHQSASTVHNDAASRYNLHRRMTGDMLAIDGLSRFRARQLYHRELIEVVDLLPERTLNYDVRDSYGRPIPSWPLTIEQREENAWLWEQKLRRRAKTAGDAPLWPPSFNHKTVSQASMYAAQTSADRGTGKKGVSYRHLPATSSHNDGGHPRPGNLDAWMLDSGASGGGFKTKYGLKQLHQLRNPVLVGGIINGPKVLVTTAGILDNVVILYDPRLNANCISKTALIDAGWKVTYHEPTDAYLVVTKSGHQLHFERFIMSNGMVTSHYLCHPSLPYDGPVPVNQATVYATSVEGNKAMFTKHDIKAAEIAQRHMVNMGGSLEHAIRRIPELRGVNITANAVKNANTIYGPVRSYVQGSATSVQDVAVSVDLPKSRPKPIPQTLSIDLCKILNHWFVVGVILPCHYLVAVNVPDHTAPVILGAVKSIVNGAKLRNFDIVQIQADGEKGIHSIQMKEYCAASKIRLVPVGAGQHEATVERYTRTLKSEVRSISASIVLHTLPGELVVHMVLAGVTKINMRLTSALAGDLSPHQLWTNTTQIHAQDNAYTFGDLALAKTPNQQNNMVPRSDTVMVLYPTLTGLHGYAVYKLGTEKVVVRNHNTLRPVPWKQEDIALIDDRGSDDPDGSHMPNRDGGVDNYIAPPASRAIRKPVTTQSPPATKSTFVPGKKEGVYWEVPFVPGEEDGVYWQDNGELGVHMSMLTPEDDTKDWRHSRELGVHRVTINRLSITKAMLDQPDETAAAIRAEMQQMLTLGVFAPVMFDTLDHDSKKATIRSMCFLTHKYTPGGEFIKCKARLVAGGDAQDKALYTSTSSPTATTTAILFVGGDAAHHGKIVKSMDVQGAFLNASLEPTGVIVHMLIEPRVAAVLASLDPSYTPFLRKDGSVCVRLVKALYGTVEAALLWYKLITKVLVDHGFVPNPYDKCILNKTLPSGDILTVALYVDDLLVTCKRPEPIDELKAYLMTQFPDVTSNCTSGIVDYIGMTLDFQKRPGAMCVTMKKITDDIIKVAAEFLGKAIKHPQPAEANLFDIDESSPRLLPVAESYYRTMIAKCLYAAKRSRPDFLLPVAFLTTRVNCCTLQDLDKLERVTGYITATPDRGTCIEFGPDPMPRLWADAAYSIHEKDKKSHTGASLVFGKGGPLYVTSVKQSIVTKSSTEAELVAFSDVGSEAISLHNFSIAQGYPDVPAIMYQDNNSAMALIEKGGPCSKRSRHIDIRYFWLKERIDEGVVRVERCPTEIMWANLLTKPLAGNQFITERQGLTNWENDDMATI